MTDPGPGTLPDEWDDDTLAQLRDDGPHTVSELVLVPGYTQSEWDRRQVRQLRLAHEGETYLWEHLEDKTPEVLRRDLLLLLGRPRAAAAYMAGALVQNGVYVNPGSGLPPVDVVIEGTVRYAEVTPAPRPKAKAKPRARPRPSRARKTAISGGGAP